METRANYVAIGLFMLTVLFGAFGAMWWLYKGTQSGSSEVLRIIFPEAVTGLSTGAGVYFNGIRVGEVTSLRFPPGGGKSVIAITRVNPDAPIKVDTTAQLASQGLTGVAYVSLAGGSGESLWEDAEEDDKVPTLEAKTSAFTNVLDTLQSVLGRLDATLGAVRNLVDENQGNLTGVITDMRTISGQLAQAAPTVPNMVDNISNAAGAVAEAVPHVQSAVDQVDTILQAIEPARVGQIVTNVEDFTGRLPQIGDDASSIVADVRGVVTRLDDAAATLGEGVRAATNVIESVDPSAVSNIIKNVETTTDTIASHSQQIGEFVTNASAASASIQEMAAALASRRAKVEAAIDDAGALIADARRAVQSATPAIEGVGKAIGAIDPQRITDIVGNVETVTTNLAGQSERLGTLISSATDAAQGISDVAGVISTRREAIGTTLDDAAAIAGRLREGAEGVPQLVTSAEELLNNASATVRAVDAGRINDVVDNVDRFTATLAAQGEAVADTIVAARGTAQRAESIASAIAQRMPEIGTAIDDAAATVASARQAADRLPEMVASLEPGIQNASDVLSAIDPSAITAIVDDVRGLTDTLSAQGPAVTALISSARDTADHANTVAAGIAQRMPQIGQAIDDATATVASARQAADKLPEFMTTLEPGIQNVSDVLSAIDPASIEAIIANVEDVTATVQAQAPAVERIINRVESVVADAGSVAADARVVAQEVAARRTEIGTAIDDATATVASARQAADRLPQLVASLEPGINNAADVLSAIDPAAVTSIVDDVRNLTSSISAQSQTISDTIVAVHGTAERAEAIASSISARMPRIGSAIDEATAAVADVRSFTQRLPQMADSLQPGIDNVAAVLSSVDPAAVDGIVADVRAFTQTLSGEGERITAILANVDTTAARASEIATNLSTKMPQVNGVIEDVSAAARSARGFADALPGYAETLQPGIENLSAVLSAVDGAAVSAVVENLRTVSDTLRASAPEVQSLIATAGTVADDAAAIANDLRNQMPTINAGIQDARGAVADVRTFTATLPALREQIDPVIERVTQVASAVDPAAVRAIVDNVRDVSMTLSEQRANLSAIVGTVGDASRRIDQVAAAVSDKMDAISDTIDSARTFAGGLRDVTPELDGIVQNVSRAAGSVADTVSSVNAEAINRILANAERVAEAVGSRTGEIGAAIDNVVNAARDLAQGLGSVGGEDGLVKEVLDRVDRISANVESASQRLGTLIDSANSAFGARLQSVYNGITDATGQVTDVAAAFAPRANQIAGGIAKFSQSGLDDLRALLNQGRSTLAAIESAVSSFDRNPSRVIFGGDSAPRYSPQRR